MSIAYRCDGCGKIADGEWVPWIEDDPDLPKHADHGRYFKPRLWFEREDEDGMQHACSRECIGKTATKTGKTALVLPI